MPKGRLWFVVLAATLVSSTVSEGKSALKGSLSGRITNSPGLGISVRLKRAESNPLASYDGYLGEVSENGSFHFDDVAPGRYTVVAEGAEFMPSEYGAAIPGGRGIGIELKAGEHRKGIAITLAPKRIVCGKVTDEKGTPQPNVEIYTFRHRKGTDWLALDDPDNMRTVSDAEGNYRLPDLDPGQYFLQAGMSTWFSQFDKLTQIEAENFTNAEPVEVGVAKDSKCDINFLMRPRLGYRSGRIRGTIADDPAFAAKNLVLSFLEVNAAGAINKWPFDVLNAGHSFDLQAPPAGKYRLTVSSDRFPVMWAGPISEFHPLASQDVFISDKGDFSGITLRATPLAALTGRVKLKEILPRVGCPGGGEARIGIQNDENGDYYSVEFGPDGAFAIPDVALRTYRVRFYPFVRGRVYVGSLVFDGRAVEGRRIDLSTPGAHTLDAILSGNLAAADGHVAPDEEAEKYEEPWMHPKASLSGRVTNPAGDGRIRVKLWAVRFNSDRSLEYSTKPNEDGTFAFENIDPGIYVLLTQGAGYVISEYGATYPGAEGKAITLVAGQRLTGITLTAFLKKPLLCGKVLDENGQGVSDVVISAWRQTLHGGYLVPSGSNDVTVKDGGFQFNNLVPGRYFVWADRQLQNNNHPSVAESTYFPSSSSLVGAEPIDVGYEPDSECKHNIQFRQAPAFHIRGTVPQNLPHKDDEVFDIRVTETNAAGVERWSGVQTKLRPGDRFDFAGVHSGAYVLSLLGPYKPHDGQMVFSGPCGPPSPALVSTENIEVKDRDVDDLAIDPGSRAALAGEVRLENIPKYWQGFEVNVSLRRENALCAVAGAKLSPEGAFSFDHMEEGAYRVELDLRGPLYIKSILFNGRPVDGRYIALRRGKPAKLEVTVAGDGGTVEAEVAHDAPLAESGRGDEPCVPRVPTGPWAFLIPDRIPEDGSGVFSGQPTSDGFIKFEGLPPGLYRAIAGENFDLLHALGPFGISAWQDLRYLQALSAFGRAVTVEAGQTVRIKIPAATSLLQDTSAKHQQLVTNYDRCAGSCSRDDTDDGGSEVRARTKRAR